MPPMMPGMMANMMGAVAKATPQAKASASTAAAPEPKAAAKTPPLTTVYIGRLPPGLEDDFVRSLLEQCGRVLKWNRASDPNSGKLTTFGFCEFETLEGVWHARECLHEQELLTKKLLVKCEEKSAAQVDEWKEEKIKSLKTDLVAEKVAAGADPLATPGGVQVSDEEATVKLDAELAAVKEALETLIAEKNKDNGTSAKAEGDKDKGRDRDRDRDRRDRSRSRGRDGGRAVVGRADRSRSPRRERPPAPEPDWKRFKLGSSSMLRETKRDRERIKKWDEKQKDLDREYRKRVQAVEKAELKWEDEATREKKLERERAREKRKMIETDLADDGMHETISTRRQDERRRERKQDEQERILEQERAKAEAEKKRKQEEERRKKEEEEAARQEEEDRRRAEKDRREREAEAERRKVMDAEAERQKAERGISLNMGGSKGKVADVFAESKAEAEGKAEKHKPLTRLEESTSAATTAAEEKKKQMEATKALIAQIPSAKEEIFGFPIDWDIVAQHSIVEKKLRPWVRKKVVEYLGAEEEAMIEFIIRKVESKAKPQDIFNELVGFLDDEAEGFVVKMWRMVIFEVLRCKQ